MDALINQMNVHPRIIRRTNYDTYERSRHPGKVRVCAAPHCIPEPGCPVFVAEHGLYVSLGRVTDARVQIKELFDEVSV